MDNTQDIVETPEKAPYDPLQDLWTDEQEISLLKGIVKWKPAGKSTLFFPFVKGSPLQVCTNTSA